MRILLMSNMDMRRPYGNFTRPFYLGQELSRFAEVYQLGYDCEGIGYGRSRSIRSYSVPRCLSALGEAIRDFRPDVVYAQENRPNLCAYVMSRASGAGRRSRVIFDFHASPAFEYGERGQRVRSLVAGMIESRVLKRGGRIIVASEYLRGLLRDRYGVDDPGRIRVVSNGVPARMLEAERAPRSPYDFPEGTRVALAILPRNFESNVIAARFTVEVARRLQGRPRLKFVIVGGGPEIPAPPNVVFTGYVDDVIPYIDWSDACLSPYPPAAHCGGARNKLLEFFARRRPVISTREGMRGIEEARDGEHFVQAGDTVEEFAGAVEAFLAKDRDPPGIVEAAFGLVDGKYNWSHAGRNLIRILEGG